MTDIDVSKIKVGDVVGFRVVDTDTEDATICIRVGDGSIYDFWCDVSSIVSHTPAPRPALKVGDRVRDPDGEEMEIAAPPRTSTANAGEPEVATWSDASGYFFRPLSEVETWERLS